MFRACAAATPLTIIKPEAARKPRHGWDLALLDFDQGGIPHHGESATRRQENYHTKGDI